MSYPNLSVEGGTGGRKEREDQRRGGRKWLSGFYLGNLVWGGKV